MSGERPFVSWGKHQGYQAVLAFETTCIDTRSTTQRFKTTPGAYSDPKNEERGWAPGARAGTH